MTVQRLEEIAAWASQESQVARLDGYTAVPQVLEDLARCARFAATLEKAMHAESCPVELYGYRCFTPSWSWYTGVGVSRKRSAGTTAIEAVEAAGGGK